MLLCATWVGPGQDRTFESNLGQPIEITPEASLREYRESSK